MHSALLNPAVRRDSAYKGLFSPADYADVAAFYDSRPDLAPTPLLELPALAMALGIGALLVKDETARFGLSAFKSLGARYAMARIPEATLRRGVVCATAGNHGRAVARAARDLRVACTVFVPAPVPESGETERTIRDDRIGGMRADGAHVIDVPGTYEEAVERAAAHGARTGATIVSDTSWPGYDAIPHDIMAGYTRLFAEAARQWSAVPDVVIVQGGVGGLVCAAASWLAFEYGADRPVLIACEPETAACLMESARAGSPVRLEVSPASRTFMSGLRCAEPSPAAWPAVRDGVDAFVAIRDDYARDAMNRLAGRTTVTQPPDPPIDAGPSGACGVGALLALAAEPVLAGVRAACQFGTSTRILAIVTEGK